MVSMNSKPNSAPRTLWLRRAVRRVTAVGVAFAVTFGLTGVRTDGAQVREYEIKAAFLLNFVRFVDWPADSQSAGRPVSVCVVGSDSVDDSFKAIGGRRIRGRSIVYSRIRFPNEASACDVLFVADTEKARIPDLLPRVDGSHLLTVGETDRFVDVGGVIGFVYRKNELRFEVNLDAAQRAGIGIRSELLTLASDVRGGGRH